ncbi:glycosyltransferase [Planctomycetota bacterium]
MKPIPILYIIDKMAIGGSQRHLAKVIPRLGGMGFDPYLCCLQQTGPLAENLDPGRVFCLGLTRIYTPRALFGIRKLIRFMREKQIMVAHSYLFSANIYGAAAACLAGVPVNLNSRRDTQFGKKLRHWVALRLGNEIVDGVVVNSAELVKFISEKENLEQSRIYKIYNGISTFPLDDDIRTRTRSALGLADGDICIGYLARFRPSKDHATALRAAACLCREHPHARFVFVGEGDTRPEAEIMASKLGIEKYCIFTGERRDVTELAQAFDIAVFTSIAEGFPNALLEVMMAAKPVVASNISGNNEGVLPGINGFLVDTGDYGAFARQLDVLIRNKDFRKRMGMASRRRVLNTYTLDGMVHSMAELYRALLAEKRGTH